MVFDGFNLATSNAALRRQSCGNIDRAPERDRCRRSLAIATLLLFAACSKESGNPAPVRVIAPAKIPIQKSHVVVPASIQITELQDRLNAEIPVQLYTIDKQEPACIAGRKIGKLQVTPDISCHLVGYVSRGPIRLSGEGTTLRLAMPVAAKVSAKNIGGIIKSETATAAAEVHAVVQLDLSRDWQPRAKIVIDYDWTEPPGVKILGQRITFAHKADPKLAEVIARLERDIPRHLSALRPRARLAEAWASGFTSVQLNRKNPEVWLRITPQRLDYGGYQITGETLSLKLAVIADAETFVGGRPRDSQPTPLPPSGIIGPDRGFHFIMPVVADYSQLEPVLEKALGKLAKKGVNVPDFGTVNLKFGKVTMYATENGRMAIGVKVDVDPESRFTNARGTVWSTGVPYNNVGSQRVMVRDLRIDGTGDNEAGRLLLAVGSAPSVQTEVARAVSHDFIGDFDKLLVKIDRALTDKRIGGFVLNAKVSKVVNGSLQPLGQGVYMPVEVYGSGNLSYRPLGNAR